MTNANEWMQLEQDHVLQTYARAPFVLDRGQGCWVYDTDGERLSGLRGGHRGQCARPRAIRTWLPR